MTRCFALLAALWVCLATSVAAIAQDTHVAITPVPRGDNWVKQHESYKAIAARGDIDLVFLGDSITQGWRGGGKAAWARHYGKRKAANFGISGDRTEHVLWRIDQGTLDGIKPKLIVLMIGTNNIGHGSATPEQTAEGVLAIVDRIRSKLPDTKVLLLGVFPRSANPGDAQRAQVGKVNELIHSLADWQTVHYLDIGHVFVDGEGKLPREIMPDALHLSPKGYDLWAQAIEFKVAELMGESSDRTVELFDGRTLKGWVNAQGSPDVNGWAVEEGMLKTSDAGDDLYTAESFGDFDFQVEWRVGPKGNSGIFYRWAKYPQGMLGPEYQIIDDLGFGMAPTAGNATGANYAIYSPPEHNPIRPAGDWNHTRIVARGGHVEHWLNGVRIGVYEEGSEDWQQRVSKSKFAGFTDFATNPARSGQFILQNYRGDEVSFRDFRLEKLGD